MKTENELCIGCNKCIFCCPTNANNAVLEGEENKVCVDETLCISCGACMDICDHNARLVEDDIKRFFADLQSGKTISLIAAPSVKYNIDEYERLFGYLQGKGVRLFYDVSLGADITTWGYIKAAREQDISSMIAGPCPVVVDYIEKFKPELISSLAPVHSPAVCIAIYMKKYMGITDDIAFLSPCVAKGSEIIDKNTHGYISYNITYASILKYLESENIDIMDYKQHSFDNIAGNIGLTFARPGGLCENVRFYLGDDIWIYQIEGMQAIKPYLAEYAQRKCDGQPVPFLVDALNCEQGCNFGTGTLQNIAIDDVNYKTDKLKKSVDRENAQRLFAHFDKTLKLVDFERNYTDKSQQVPRAKAEDVEETFRSLEKYTEAERKVNCFSCGFGSCQEFANAVALGKNHKDNCLRYSYKKISEQKEELFEQGLSLYEQRKLLERKNQELTETIEYVSQVEESLKVEREINDFAVKNKYELVSLLDVDKRVLTVYKRSLEFEKGGLQSAGDYDAAATTVLNNMVHADDHEHFKSLFFDNLIAELNKNGEFVLEYRLLDEARSSYRWKRVSYRYFSNSNNIVIQLSEDIHNDMVIKKELEANNEKLLLHEQCFRALSEHTNKVIFEWDFQANKIIAMTSFDALFGKCSEAFTDEGNMLSIKYIHKDDHAVFIAASKSMLSGNAVNDIRFRVKDRGGIYHWCSLSGIVIKDKAGQLFRAIGILESIAEQINKEESLREKAEHDQLTGLYNKATAEYLIKNALENSQDNAQHTLMIIDIDNYKNINDRLGHLYGDIVLTQLATALKGIFRKSDIIGRIGGDEFFVFIEDYASQELLLRKATEICKLFCRTYSEGEKRESISASVGIALYPEHGQGFEELYKNADIALYDVKISGKNHFKIYSGEKTSLDYVADRTDIDSTGENRTRFKENRVEYIFRLLYESDDVSININAALQFMTEHFGFSRGYIFETDSSGRYTSNTFEWCNEGISPEIDSLQNLPIEIWGVANKGFKATGVFIVEDISTLAEIERAVLERQNIKSMLQFGIVKQGEIIGFIGFDDCVNTRTPTPDELEEFKLICNIFATFLTKQRAAEDANKNYKAMLSILNNFEGYAYVIDRDSYKVVFENANTRKTVGKSSVGKYCYQEYMHKENPCEDCPIAGISDTVSHSTREMYNKTYKVYTRTTATNIDWINSKSNYLISSVDVTEYKK